MDLILYKSKTIDRSASKSLALGVAYSMNKKIDLLSQSIYCDEFFDDMKLKYYKINRLLNNNIKVNKNN